jgi:NAD(P)-dependent dehydrogenase (short-subunit alcohol dehydrogenase family)
VPLFREDGQARGVSHDRRWLNVRDEHYGANHVVPNTNVVGPVMAALEAACRYLAYELGPQGIRVHAISPDPLKTRAASGPKNFELMPHEAAQKTRGANAWTSWTSATHALNSRDAVREARYGRADLRRRRR